MPSFVSLSYAASDAAMSHEHCVSLCHLTIMRFPPTQRCPMRNQMAKLAKGVDSVVTNPLESYGKEMNPLSGWVSPLHSSDPPCPFPTSPFLPSFLPSLVLAHRRPSLSTAPLPMPRAHSVPPRPSLVRPSVLFLRPLLVRRCNRNGERNVSSP